MKVKTSRSTSKVPVEKPEKPEQLVLHPYESITILKPTLSDEEIAEAIEKIKGIIEEAGGEIVSSDNWGKKRLAYEVKKERRGIYIVQHFKAKASTIIVLERHYRFSESIIKYMTVKIETETLGQSQPPKEDKAFSYRGRVSRGWR
ncbi:SSU ribosomal protein S6p [hydrothermal vent metagenome]|uniref:SSU ribosomal protein S6p n=1 Tax=hydrothermal vent metagenome TaxID=652676 RepID=A0A3B1CVM5_9ZZZZ